MKACSFLELCVMSMHKLDWLELYEFFLDSRRWPSEAIVSYVVVE